MKKILFTSLIITSFLINLAGQQAHVNLDWDPQKNICMM
jgi:hypothetical protein